ncbi:Canalicular multispecific organic anion transporter 2 [Bulinus truncatus]|nr:Canalicular multispecific organic anion transporter 2 [Bulinus truncatus]
MFPTHSDCMGTLWIAMDKSACLYDILVSNTEGSSQSITDFKYYKDLLINDVYFQFLSIIIVQIDRRYGRINSLPLFFFWLLMAATNVIPFYTNIIEKIYEVDATEFATQCCISILLIVQFFVFCFAEKRGNDGYIDLSKSATPSLELTASLPSMFTFWWTNKLIWTGYKKTLTESDVNDLHPEDVSSYQVPRFEKAWQKEVDRCEQYNKWYIEQFGPLKTRYSSIEQTVKLPVNEKSKLLPKHKDKTEEKKDDSPLKKPSLIRVLFKVYGLELVCLQITRTCFDLLSFVTPKITEALLAYIQGEKKDTDIWKGYLLATSYFVALTISNEAKKESTLGEIVNLMSVDCQRLENVMNYCYIFFSAPFQIAIALYMLYEQIGVATFAGLGVILILMPMNTLVSVSLRKFNRQMMKLKDRRIRLMNELLNGMKVLKVYGWEEAFEKKVSTYRSEEIRLIFKLSFVMASLSLIFQIIPYFVQVASFGVFIAVDGYLDPSKAFVSISLFNILTSALSMMPMFIPALVQAGVSITRIVGFFRQPDLNPNARTYDPKLEEAIKIENGTFTWDNIMPEPTLKNINIKLHPGKLVAVVGTVGCGKSSLLSAILGEMNKIKGQVTVKYNNMAYVPQEAWIQNATLRDNILFATDFKSSLYNKVIEACALKSDLDILPGGDQTEIGEKGINISGGQKQRVSLARAVYSRSDIYLLDDPLSAVDSHVGKHIFQEVISNKGMLKGKTRIMVTHGVHWLPMVDFIIVMKNGGISETGSYEQLVSHDGEFAQFLKEFFIQEADALSEDETSQTQDPEIEEMKKQVLTRLESLTGASSADELGNQSYHRKLSLTVSARRDSWTASTNLSLSNKHESLTGSSKQKHHGGHAAQEERQGGRHARGGGQTGTRGRGGKGRGFGGLPDDLEEQEPPSSEKGLGGVVKGQRLVQAEKAETGGVKMKVYLDYIRSVGSYSTIFSFLCYLVYMGSNIFSGIWLSMWTDDTYLANRSLSDTEEYADKTNLYIGLYGGLGVIQGIFTYSFSASMLVKTVVASNVLHNAMLNNIMRSPMAFFDTTPIGRIVNRFSKDVDVLDNMLPNVLRQSVQSMGRVLISLINISYSTPIVLSVIVPVVILYVLMQRVYIPASRQIRRIDSTTKSPVYVHFSETLSGVSSIRAYAAQERFYENSMKLVDYNMKFYFGSIVASSWLQIRLQFLGNVIVLAAAMFAQADTGLTAGLAGLAVSYAQMVTGALSQVIQVATQAETNIVSAERILEYSEIQTEAAWKNPKLKLPEPWPEEGEIELNDLEIRYRDGLELVLRGITCKIKGGEKVGIVGRTGAGKSSLSVALFRLVEAASGKISIDSNNIAHLGLHDLRKNITILPQDPVIFSGSLRMNLDPAEMYTEDQIWQALEHAHLKNFVTNLPSQLDYECGEGGQNLSMGQRQLVCLARCLLRKSKIIVLDEATAAVDMETDDLIQKTIRTEFKSSTVLTIAHRLNTIMDYDRVIVMDKGKIKEMDSPQALLSDPQSTFYSMAKDANLV